MGLSRKISWPKCVLQYQSGHLLFWNEIQFFITLACRTKLCLNGCKLLLRIKALIRRHLGKIPRRIHPPPPFLPQVSCHPNPSPSSASVHHPDHASPANWYQCITKCCRNVSLKLSVAGYSNTKCPKDSFIGPRVELMVLFPDVVCNSAQPNLTLSLKSDTNMKLGILNSQEIYIVKIRKLLLS